jgi:hypothetical protein
MTASLETLAIAAYVFADSLRIPRPGPKGEITDKELIALAVCQAAMGINSDRQFLGLVPFRLRGFFPHRAGDRPHSAPRHARAAEPRLLAMDDPRQRRGRRRLRDRAPASRHARQCLRIRVDCRSILEARHRGLNPLVGSSRPSVADVCG